MTLFQQTEPTRAVDSGCLPEQQWSYLMCPPDFFGVLYEINPWMSCAVQPDLALAREQWSNLVAHLRRIGAAVEIMSPVASLPDMVFTADIGLVTKQRFVTSRFRYAERRREVDYGASWFRDASYEVSELALEDGASFESSDILPFRGRLLAGYGFRTTLSAHIELARILGRSLCSVKLVNPRLYHLDVCFCPLDERHALVAPDAWTRRGCEVVKRLVPEPLVLEMEEALTFCANSLVVGKTILMPACPVRVRRVLDRWGFDVCVVPVSEFLKAGGAVHCLTLPLHLSL